MVHTFHHLWIYFVTSLPCNYYTKLIRHYYVIGVLIASNLLLEWITLVKSDYFMQLIILLLVVSK